MTNATVVEQQLTVSIVRHGGVAPHLFQVTLRWDPVVPSQVQIIWADGQPLWQLARGHIIGGMTDEESRGPIMVYSSGWGFHINVVGSDGAWYTATLWHGSVRQFVAATEVVKPYDLFSELDESALVGDVVAIMNAAARDLGIK